ncbi:MAG: DUF192 domain-containing protein [Spirochaetaceae bacterium]|nr:DUF192 domain-containing protein [Spirochaetaceae bacterium]
MRAARKCACAALAGLLAVALVACRGGAAETVRLGVGEERFTVWVARTSEQRARGLMYRTDLGPRQGMLFVFENEQVLSFWMKNTPLPLSIAFLSADGEILQIEPLTPFSEVIVSSWRPARYALEVNAGAFAEAGAQVGDLVGFPRNWR